MSFCILGVDPGLSGAVAFYFPDHPNLITAEDTPVVDGQIDVAQLAERIRQMKPDAAIVEHVGAMPGQGVSSMFKFGQSVGCILGILGALQIPVHRAAPTRWKKHFLMSADKEEARAKAISLWPSSDAFRRKKDHGRAEAALLARFFVETQKGLLSAGRPVEQSPASLTQTHEANPQAAE